MVPELAQPKGARTGRLESDAHLAGHLAELGRSDPTLLPIIERAGPVALRRSDGGFAGLARIIIGQQVSTQSADAIWGRFAAIEGALEPGRHLRLDAEAYRRAGLSAAKITTLSALAAALTEGRLDLDGLADLPAEAAMAALTGQRGIGPWTAGLYLMFAAGHPDIFPAGDVALQRAVQWGFGLDDKPSAKTLSERAEAWSPWRTAAAHLFWRYYRALRSKEGVSI